MHERRRSSVVWAWPSCRLPMLRMSHWSGQHSIFCNDCKHWVHKKCRGLKLLTKDPDYRCTQCQGTACPSDSRPQRETQVGPDRLEMVASFSYLGDMLSAAGGWEDVWKPPGRSSRSCYQLSLPATSLSKRHGHVYTRVQSAMLHASETWPLTVTNLQRLRRNDRALIRQICNVKQDIVTIRSNELLVLLGIEDLDLILKERRLCWYGHVEWPNSAVKTTCDIQGDGKRGCEICHVCSKPATWKTAHWCGCCPCTHTLIKNLVMVMMIMIMKNVCEICRKSGGKKKIIISGFRKKHMHILRP